jgi:hypothetical protein
VALLQFHVILNSTSEEVLAFKTCCGLKVFDQNVEIRVRNTSDHPVSVASYFDIEDEHGVTRVDTLLPHGVQVVQPGALCAFYCALDEARIQKARQLIFYDCDHNAYPCSQGDPDQVKAVPSG